MDVERYAEVSQTKYWSSLDLKLTDKIEIDNETRIEDQPSSVIVDFANKYLGGGALSYGLA